MTIINPNSISGIVSVTATSNALHFYESDGDKLNINADVTGNVIGNLTGNVTGTTATFSGDVTVGGVLTYDDVTSIDSVGVVTARDGIHVTGGSVIIGDTDTDNANAIANDLVVGNTSQRSGITIVSGSGDDGNIFFSDGTGTAALKGQIVYNHTSDRFSFYTAAAERIRIDSSGRLLIGRTSQLASSAERLTIDSGMGLIRNNSTSTGALYLRNEDSTADTRHPYLIFTDGSGNRGGIGVQNDQSSLWISGQQGIAFRTGGTAPSTTERLRISSDGKVTITTGANSASPAGSGDNLVIKDSNGCGLSILSGNGNSQNIYLGSTSDNDGTRLEGFYNSGSPYFNIYIANTQRLRISSDGLIDASTNTNAVALPQGTTAQRPTGSAPYIRKNTTNNALEYYDGTSWVEIITDYFPTGSVILG